MYDFAEAIVAAKVFAAVCIEGYFRLTDIAARSKFSMQVGEHAPNVAIARHGLRGRDACRGPTGRFRFSQA